VDEGVHPFCPACFGLDFAQGVAPREKAIAASLALSLGVEFVPPRDASATGNNSAEDSARVCFGVISQYSLEADATFCNLFSVFSFAVLVFHTQYLRVAAFSAWNSLQGYRRSSRPPPFSYDCRTVEASAAVARQPCSCVFVSAWSRSKRRPI